MVVENILDTIRLLFLRDKQFYCSFYDIMGFYPHKVELYRQALTHRSLNIKDDGGRALNNERLEFLGDAILDAVVSDILYNQFQRKPEGFLTSVRSRIVQRESLGRLADAIGLTELILSNQMFRSHNNYMAGNAFEALIGAIYLDRGYEYCKWFVTHRIIGKHINLEQEAFRESNFKSRLLEWCNKHRVQATFELLEERTDPATSSPRFLSRVNISGKECGRGMGYSKKESHQQAAMVAIKRLKSNSQLRSEVLSEAESADATHNISTSNTATHQTSCQ